MLLGHFFHRQIASSERDELTQETPVEDNLDFKNRMIYLESSVLGPVGI